MSTLGLIDIGGTSIKFAIWQNDTLTHHHAVPTPKTKAEFMTVLTTEVAQMKTQAPITGVGISSPGAVNKVTGVIEGASAIPYIHNFPIQAELVERFGVPVSLENDANCAALAELAGGAGAGASSLAFLVIGTGVGGALIFNHQIWHGAHLFGGEFGYTKINDHGTLSELGTVPNAIRRYLAATGKQLASPLTGEKLYTLAAKADLDAQRELNTMYAALAQGIFNIQYSFDPEKIVLGGGISNNPQLIPGIETALDKIYKQVEIATIRPELALCRYTSEANLRGAAVDFEQSTN
ncbi:ROK family protein [Lactiplantibacillus sp. WILCCON 0030]|uniref:ROK family protein n=1 Tax=Lactiplantibacillus brownii TaxID=3069269 RepID=A0ABU1ACX5_9LACO|nr:ROK family protein [Lactiplantibacillus brownii]MDQ7938686.1 ROK family protein [Lactiplantibacillus brownii]